MEKRATVDGVVKRRAGRACALCRSRKVRCDVVRSGPPCTNCQLDSLECIVPRSKRHKVSKAGKSAVPPVASPGGGGRIAPGITSQQAGRHHQHGYHTIDTLNDMVYPSLPNFILPLPTGLDRAEMRYLYEKNAFLLPTDAFRSVCLARYLEFTHPLLPLLDKAQVVSILDSENVAKRPMALLLFHAVMCAGVTFVDDEIIKREGFESKQSARRAFFNRAKVRRIFLLPCGPPSIFKALKKEKPLQVLFDCNAEPDTFVAVQTAILMSTWHPGKEKKNTWYWAGTALSLACSIGLHLEPDALRFDVPEQHLRRRVWWCAFAREQKIALALGRAPRITYYGVAMLTPKDFEEEVPDFSNSVDPLPEVMQALSALDDPSMQDALAGLCIEHMKVCVSIALFLSTIFESRKQVEGRGGDLADYGEYPPPSPSSRLDYCAQEFARWYRERPLNLRYEAHGAISSQDTIKHTRSLIVHKATVHVVYYVAVSALYRLKALSPSSTWCNKHGELQGASQRILRQSAWELTDVNWELYNAGLSPYLSTTAVGSVVAAVVVHLLDTKSQDKTVISCAFWGIQQCKQVLLSLRGTYGTEVEALGYLKAVERDLPEEQQASQVRHEVDPYCRYAGQRPLDPGEEPILMRPQNAPSPTLAQIQDSCEFESPRLTEIDEIFWQSCFEEAPSCDFFRFGLPHDDQ